MSWISWVVIVVMAFDLVFFGILLGVFIFERWRRRRK